MSENAFNYITQFPTSIENEIRFALKAKENFPKKDIRSLIIETLYLSTDCEKCFNDIHERK